MYNEHLSLFSTDVWQPLCLFIDWPQIISSSRNIYKTATGVHVSEQDYI